MSKFRKRSNKSSNEHAFDCVAFMALAAPHRWMTVREFFVDLNGTKDFKMTVDDCRDRCYGSCGLPPDQALIQKEGDDPFDLRADKNNWSLAQRKLERWYYDRIKAVSRLHWIDEQVNETLRTGEVDFALMTPPEQGLFVQKLQHAKAKREAGRNYAVKRYQLYA